MLRDPVTVGLATAFVWTAVASALIQCLLHLRNYTEPLFQRYILRIIFLVPFYGITSWLSLMHRESAIYFDVPRDCYEAWVIYNFLSLCMAYVGGPGAVVVKAEGKVINPSWLLMTCCWPPIKVDGFLLRKCKQGTLQFVIAKPFLASFTLILFAANKYHDGVWSPKEGYLYIAIIYNTCYTVALYYMLLFYVGCEELLEPFRPLLKIALIKTVIFLTFWQSIVISFFSSKFKDETDSAALQDWMVCLEMLLSAIMMWVAFPHTEFKMGGQTAGWRLRSFIHAVSITDVISDILHQFNPNYKTYLLYADGGPTDNVKRKTFRGQGHKGISKAKEKAQKASSDGSKRGGRGDGAAGELAGGDGEGEVYEPGGKPGGKLLKWVPGISNSERRQAVLVDSDSDADYDADNQQDHQLDKDVMTDSDDENLPKPQRMSEIGADTSQRVRAPGAGGDVEMGRFRKASDRGEVLVHGAKAGLNRIMSIAREAVQAPLDLGEESEDDDRML